MNDLDSPYLTEITRILRQALQGMRCRVYLFGSRATGRHRVASDFDIAVECSDELSRVLGIAREMLEESNIPFTVDLVELKDTSEVLRRQVLEQGILLWSN
jgi:predicted nucleotidyltransferase